MRFFKTYILRLYIDPDLPERLCGELQVPPEPEQYPFISEAVLIRLLHQLSANPASEKKGKPRRPTHEKKNVD